MKFYPIIYFSLSFLFILCTPISVETIKNQKIIQWNEMSLAILISTSEEKDGAFNDHLWIRGDLKDPKNSFSLFNEWTDLKTNLPKRRLWHGPNSYKLVEWYDSNSNGVWEEKHYYNKFAGPKILLGHIARIDFDIDEDGKVDLSYFPFQHFERLDKKGNCIGELNAKKMKPEILSEFFRTKGIKVLGKFQQTNICWKKEPWKATNETFIPVYISE